MRLERVLCLQFSTWNKYNIKVINEIRFHRQNRFSLGFILTCFVQKQSLYSPERKISPIKKLTIGLNLFSYE